MAQFRCQTVSKHFTGTDYLLPPDSQPPGRGDKKAVAQGGPGTLPEDTRGYDRSAGEPVSQRECELNSSQTEEGKRPVTARAGTGTGFLPSWPGTAGRLSDSLRGFRNSQAPGRYPKAIGRQASGRCNSHHTLPASAPGCGLVNALVGHPSTLQSQTCRIRGEHAAQAVPDAPSSPTGSQLRGRSVCRSSTHTRVARHP